MDNKKTVEVMPVQEIPRAELEKGTQVAVTVQPFWESKTMAINTVILIATMFVSVLDIISGANLLEPIVAVFVPNDPEAATRVVTTVSQIYSVMNIILRYKTQSPVALPKALRE